MFWKVKNSSNSTIGVPIRYAGILRQLRAIRHVANHAPETRRVHRIAAGHALGSPPARESSAALLVTVPSVSGNGVAAATGETSLAVTTIRVAALYFGLQAMSVMRLPTF